MLLTLLWKSAVYPGYTTRLHFRKKLQSSRLVIVLNLRMVHHPKWDTNHRKILNITRVRQTYEMGFKELNHSVKDLQKQSPRGVL